MTESARFQQKNSDMISGRSKSLGDVKLKW